MAQYERDRWTATAGSPAIAAQNSQGLTNQSRERAILQFSPSPQLPRRPWRMRSQRCASIRVYLLDYYRALQPATVRATLNEIECSIAIKNEGFENLVRGSQVRLEEVLERAPSNWYAEAEEAKRLGLVEAVL